MSGPPAYSLSQYAQCFFSRTFLPVSKYSLVAFHSASLSSLTEEVTVEAEAAVGEQTTKSMTSVLPRTEKKWVSFIKLDQIINTLTHPQLNFVTVALRLVRDLASKLAVFEYR